MKAPRGFKTIDHRLTTCTVKAGWVEKRGHEDYVAVKPDPLRIKDCMTETFDDLASAAKWVKE